MKKISIILISLVLVLLIINIIAGNENDLIFSKKVKGIVSDEKKYNIILSSEEVQYLNQIREKGIKVATREKEYIYLKDPKGNPTGMHYDLFSSFADYFGLEFYLKISDFPDYFKYKGRFDNSIRTNNKKYDPDIFEDVDIIVDRITIISWREKLMSLIPIYPVGEMIITRKGEEIKNIWDLIGKKCAILKETTFYDTLKNFEIKNNIKINYIFPEKSEDEVLYIQEFKADFTIIDSDRCIKISEKYDNIAVGQPIGELGQLGWGVKKDNILLYNIINKYIIYLHETGKFDHIFKKYYGITFTEYINDFDYEF